LLDLESVTAFQENISKVDSDLLHNIIVFGPRKCGKSKVARNLAKTHRRNLINFNEILEWNLNKNTQESVQAQEYLNTLLVELETVKEERDKIIKKAGKKA
jgi:hydrocephalus-inducing protein